LKKKKSLIRKDYYINWNNANTRVDNPLIKVGDELGLGVDPPRFRKRGVALELIGVAQKFELWLCKDNKTKELFIKVVLMYKCIINLIRAKYD